jgi:hypothetical protein
MRDEVKPAGQDPCRRKRRGLKPKEQESLRKVSFAKLWGYQPISGEQLGRGNPYVIPMEWNPLGLQSLVWRSP